MYECVSLTKNRITALKKLSGMSSDFNVLNEDFFETYDGAGFAGKILQRKKVRLLKKGSEYAGFIWFEYYSSNSCGIKALYSSEKEDLDAYRLLLDSIPGCRNIQYECASNGYNSRVLESLGFEKGTGEIEMCLDKEGIEKALAKRPSTPGGLVFKTFEKGKDEGLRCWIQNDIFDNDRRVPLTLNDIMHDVSQGYFLEGGAAFLYICGECAGYGQIVVHDEIPYIVNIGMIKGCRGKGYGRLLVMHFLEVVRAKGFDQVRLNVNPDNLAAMNLYRSLGFSVESETYRWKLKR
jgi:ribosomal protein S18 acetylase RimI-like enzyme